MRAELANRLKTYASEQQRVARSGPREGAVAGKTSFKQALQVSPGSSTRQGAGGVAPDRALASRRLYSRHSVPQKEITLEQAKNLARYAPAIQDASRKYNVPVELICAVILQESGGNPKAVSPAGARGLMQLMPATAKRFGVKNSFDPRQNIEGGTQYLRFLMDRFHGDYRLVLAGYNAGENNVEKYGNKIPPFAETRAYVPAVLSYADSIHQILHTPLPVYARRV